MEKRQVSSMDIIVDLLDFFRRIATNPRVNDILTIFGAVAFAWLTIWVIKTYYYVTLLFFAQFFIPVTLIFIYLSYLDGASNDLLTSLFLGGVLVSVPFFSILTESNKAYKDKKPPPFKKTIIFCGALSIVFIVWIIDYITGFNLFTAIIDLFIALLDALGLRALR